MINFLVFRKKGIIINVSSGSGVITTPLLGPYSGTKVEQNVSDFLLVVGFQSYILFIPLKNPEKSFNKY